MHGGCRVSYYYYYYYHHHHHHHHHRHASYFWCQRNSKHTLT
jgi:hypothetical protein